MILTSLFTVPGLKKRAPYWCQLTVYNIEAIKNIYEYSDHFLLHSQRHNDVHKLKLLCTNSDHTHKNILEGGKTCVPVY